MAFDYDAPAELFLAKRTKSDRKNYRRFATTAEAIRYAVETSAHAESVGRVAKIQSPEVCIADIIFALELAVGKLFERLSASRQAPVPLAKFSPKAWI